MMELVEMLGRFSLTVAVVESRVCQSWAYDGDLRLAERRHVMTSGARQRSSLATQLRGDG